MEDFYDFIRKMNSTTAESMEEILFMEADFKTI